MNKCLECGKETSNEKFCDLSCFGKYRANQKRLKSIKEYYENPKHCKECGKVIEVERHAYEATNKVFCSHSCSASYNNRKYPKRGTGEPKYCKNCGKKLQGRKRHNTFCSHSCFHNFRKKAFIEDWLSGKEDGSTKDGLSHTIRDYLLEKHKYKCSQCGWGKVNPTTGNVPLEIDHIDGNYQNNSPENVRVLCPNCHSLTPTYKALNGGNGREFRKMQG